ncbi:ABC transporter ATP-binding protein [Persicitalea jodogahamensis]|uniref:Macrolide export ATP-binding/permease protein MacB n=1 Tax=Persicitalea jodogahamensis TaxID=402147 RepID=A0A8J3GB68_9BACT|nr:ATP-binding cassette domain-containing protein [Persicitalea jodogahamensis]GHB85249.1 macrolide export ATP-binding/permease protein MacB [Persicitalea jodogahamensis]
MIASHGLTFSYSPQKKFAFPDLHCAEREALLILGQSGSGKTTLLHLLALLLTPASGEITLNGRSLRNLSAHQAGQVRAQQIGIIYQRAHFVSSLSVLDNILLANYLADKKQEKNKAAQLAEQLGFAEHLFKKPNQLSQGEQQRVSIARSLMNDPALILADEPTASLDDENCHKVVNLLKEQSHSIGASLIVVTHDQRLKEAFGEWVTL